MKLTPGTRVTLQGSTGTVQPAGTPGWHDNAVHASAPEPGMVAVIWDGLPAGNGLPDAAWEWPEFLNVIR